jgi:hypothetical protein
MTRKLGVSNRVLDVLVPEVSLQRPGVVASIERNRRRAAACAGSPGELEMTRSTSS